MKIMRKISVVVLVFYYTTGVNVLLFEHFFTNFRKKICSIPFGARDIKINISSTESGCMKMSGSRYIPVKATGSSGPFFMVFPDTPLFQKPPSEKTTLIFAFWQRFPGPAGENMWQK
nr:hypothetical protein [uncultured Methanoregula sp.]